MGTARVIRSFSESGSIGTRTPGQHSSDDPTHCDQCFVLSWYLPFPSAATAVLPSGATAHKDHIS